MWISELLGGRQEQLKQDRVGETDSCLMGEKVSCLTQGEWVARAQKA